MTPEEFNEINIPCPQGNPGCLVKHTRIIHIEKEDKKKRPSEEIYAIAATFSDNKRYTNGTICLIEAIIAWLDENWEKR